MGDVVNIAEWRSRARWNISPISHHYEFIEWLDLELSYDHLHWWEQARLNRLHGWRNREVYGYVQANKERWELEVTKRLYGEKLVPMENIRFP